MLTRDQMLTPVPVRYRDVFVPALGGHVRIRSLSELERSRIDSKIIAARTDEEREIARLESRPRWIVACVVNEDGKRLFTQRDVPAWQAQDSSITAKLYDEIMDHCGLGMNAPTVEDHEKNSDPTPDGCSPGESPCTATAGT